MRSMRIPDMAPGRQTTFYPSLTQLVASAMQPKLGQWTLKPPGIKCQRPPNVLSLACWRQSDQLACYFACYRHNTEDHWYRIFSRLGCGINAAASTVTSVLHCKPTVTADSCYDSCHLLLAYQFHIMGLRCAEECCKSWRVW